MPRSRRAWPIAGLVLAALSILACSDAPRAAHSAATAARPTVALTITVVDSDQVHSKARLSCRGRAASATGFLRKHAAAACKRARELAAFLAAKPAADRICDQIYGGPDRARMHGDVGTRAIDRRFARSDGCEIADWDRAGVLLPPSSFKP